jgi:hypothetical protein
MIDKLLFPFTFDVQKLQKEVFAFGDHEWIPHFNTGYYSGDWSAIPLRSAGGDPRRIFPDPTGKIAYQDTPHLLSCPYIKEVVDSLQCEKVDVRLLRLRAGSSIREHSDYDLAYEDGEVRVHIPVVTNARLEFFLNKERVEMKEGECWYLNFNLPHSVVNGGTNDRIHLVIDCKVNDWMTAAFNAALTPA